MQVTNLNLPPKVAVLLLKQTYKRGEDLGPDSTPAWEEWCRLARSAFAKVFGAGSYEEHRIIDDPIPQTVPISREGTMKWHDRRRECLPLQLQRLGTLITSLEDELSVIESTGDLFDEARHSSREKGNGKVFISHGHDKEVLQGVVSFFERHSVQTVALRDQPNEGQTIIEKLESYALVEYAVILFTADDFGHAALTTRPNLVPRARQNVVFELGYFMGRLGRRRVCVLYEAGVEIPSNIQGVAYIQIDRIGEWQLELAREMRNVGFGFRIAGFD